MGNKQSGPNSKKPSDINILRLMDTIASKYILTQNFEDLQRLEDKKYCDQLTILTSQIMKDKLTSLEIKYLSQRVKDGYQVNEENKDSIVFLKDEDLHALDVPSELKKKRMCMGISRFYVRVAHLFAAIVNTINPEYSYVDDNKTKHVVPFMKKMHIPKEMRSKVRVTRSGICSNRINSMLITALKDTQVTRTEVEERPIGLNDESRPSSNSSSSTSSSMVGGEKQKYNIRNRICDMNIIKKTNEYGVTVTKPKHLIDEPGIPELLNLYKDVYNPDTGKYDSMSEKSKAEYKQHLLEFYQAFTGEKVLPSNIKKFSDIELRKFHSNPKCKLNEGLNRKYSKVEIPESLMTNYGNAMAVMVKNMNENQSKLIEILDQVFIYRIDPDSDKKTITLHPDLSNEKLEEIISLARKYIVNIIVGCENDFLVTLQSFEAIIEDLIKTGIEDKISNIKQQEIEKLSNFKMT